VGADIVTVVAGAGAVTITVETEVRTTVMTDAGKVVVPKQDAVIVVVGQTLPAATAAAHIGASNALAVWQPEANLGYDFVGRALVAKYCKQNG